MSEETIDLEALKAELAALKTENEALKLKVVEAKTEAETLAADAQKVVAELKDQLAATEAEVAEQPAATEIKAGKDTYVVVIPSFKHNQTIYTAADLKKNKGLVKELIEMGSGVLVKKTED